MQTHSKHVLIVEDDELLLNMYRVVFEQHHYQVTTAADGQAALNVLQQTVPDVILLDVVMPKVGGLELLKTLKANDKLHNVPVVVTTSLTDTAVGAAAMTAGASKFIQKSEYRPEDVVKVVGQVL